VRWSAVLAYSVELRFKVGARASHLLACKFRNDEFVSQ
jgi:hypothetical protein